MDLLVKTVTATVFFGANDAVLPDVKDRQYVSLEHYRDNLISIAQHPLVKAHEPRIILITPGPIDEYQQEINDREKGYTELRRTAANAKIYAEMTRKVAKELNVPVVDTWTAFMTKAGWKEGEPLVGSKECPPNSVLRELLLDGLHFDGPGYKILYEELMKSIEKEWPDQMPDKLEMPLPEWRTAPTIPYN
ncbi:MAG: hypothetical protein M1834_009024 [Cirrosporium novae-zelandiae]|nr:MAG: hypothetical protein M1834_009024 [Cirrosporium novae-zelandiae]